jgi:hypothetical protein
VTPNTLPPLVCEWNGATHAFCPPGNENDTKLRVVGGDFDDGGDVTFQCIRDGDISMPLTITYIPEPGATTLIVAGLIGLAVLDVLFRRRDQ